MQYTKCKVSKYILIRFVDASKCINLIRQVFEKDLISIIAGVCKLYHCIS